MPKSFTIAMIIFIGCVIGLALLYSQQPSQHFNTDDPQATNTKNLPVSTPAPDFQKLLEPKPEPKEDLGPLPIKTSPSCEKKFGQFDSATITLEQLYNENQSPESQNHLRFENVTIKKGDEYFTYNIKPISVSSNQNLYRVEVFKRDTPDGIGEKVEPHPLSNRDIELDEISIEISKGDPVKEEKMIEFKDKDAQNSTVIFSQGRIIYLESSTFKCDGLGKEAAICQCW